MKISELLLENNWAKQLANANKLRMARERAEDKAAQKAKAAAKREETKKLDKEDRKAALSKIHMWINDLAGQHFPDVEPTGPLIKRIERSYPNDDPMKLLNAAAKAHGAKDYNDFMAIWWDEAMENNADYSKDYDSKRDNPFR